MSFSGWNSTGPDDSLVFERLNGGGRIDARDLSASSGQDLGEMRGDPNRVLREFRPGGGRGPRSYRRSDDRITDEVHERLTRDPDIDASDIEVLVENGEVTLSGVVEDRDAKRWAEDLIEDLPGVVDVHNRLKIRHGFLASLTGEKAKEPEARERSD